MYQVPICILCPTKDLSTSVFLDKGCVQHTWLYCTVAASRVRILASRTNIVIKEQTQDRGRTLQSLRTKEQPKRYNRPAEVRIYIQYTYSGALCCSGLWACRGQVPGPRTSREELLSLHVLQSQVRPAEAARGLDPVVDTLAPHVLYSPSQEKNMMIQTFTEKNI